MPTMLTHPLSGLFKVSKLPYVIVGYYLFSFSHQSHSAPNNDIHNLDISQQQNSFLRCEPGPKMWRCDEYEINSNELIPRSIRQKSIPAYDWIDRSELTPQQRESLAPGCRGLYLDPTKAIAEALGDIPNPDELPLVIEADRSEVIQNETALLAGNVLVTQGARFISANEMSYDLTTDLAKLTENVTIRNPGILIRGHKAEVNATSYNASFEDAMFVLHEPHLRGGAETIKQTSAKSLSLSGGSFTSCEPGDNSWLLVGDEITIDAETNQGTAKNVKLKVGPIPVLYFPYLSFPVGDERQSGFLYPSLSFSDSSGVDFSIPYYWNLAPNYDLTLTPRYITKRGAMLEAEGRHLSKLFSTVASMAYLPNDNGGLDPDVERLIAEGSITEEQAVPYKGKRRWLAHIDQLGGGLGNPWYTDLDYTKVSDVDFFRDLGTSSFAMQNNTHLNQSIESGYQFTHWHISALIQDYQVLLYDVDDPYRRAPQLNLNGLYRAADFGLKLEHEYTHFDHQNQTWSNGNTVIKGSRLNTDYRLFLNKRAAWGFFVPEVGFQTLSYDLDPNGLAPDAESKPTLATAQGSLDMGLIFEHPGGDATQTIEPRIYYLYRDYEDHSQLFNVTDDGQFVNFDTSNRTFSYSQLYRDSRFSGHDRLDDANRLTLGMTTRWFSNSSGRDLLTASAGQIFYYDDRRVGLATDVETADSSEIAADLRLALGPFTSLYASGIYDKEKSEFIRSSGGIHYASNDYKRLANVSYTYVKNRDQIASTSQGDIDQADFSFLTPVSRQWFAMGRAKYDFSNNQELETFLGLEYNNCCYRIRLLARRWLDSNIATLVDDDSALYDSGLFFEIHLKGLGSSGAKVDAILNDSIIGYRERENLLNP